MAELALGAPDAPDIDPALPDAELAAPVFASTLAAARARHSSVAIARRRLLAGLVLWDALAPIAVVGAASRVGGSGAEVRQPGRAPRAAARGAVAHRGRDRRRLRPHRQARRQPTGLRAAPARGRRSPVMGGRPHLQRRRLVDPAGPDGRGDPPAPRHVAPRALGLRPTPGGGRRADPAGRRGRGPSGCSSSPDATARAASMWSASWARSGRCRRRRGTPVLGGTDDLPRLVADHQIDRVLVAFGRVVTHSSSAAARMHRRGVQVDVVPRFYDLVGPNPTHPLARRPRAGRGPGRGLTRPAGGQARRWTSPAPGCSCCCSPPSSSRWRPSSRSRRAPGAVPADPGRARLDASSRS